MIDNFANSSIEVLERVKQLTKRDFVFVEGDVRDQHSVDALFAKFRPDAVIHFAGLKAVGESVEKSLEYYDVNVGGAICIVKAMEAAACHKIVFSSSATVYGTPKYLPYDEDHPTNPVNPYGRTKLMVEHILKDWCLSEKKRSAISLRYFNPIGAHPSGRIGEDPKGTPNNIMPLIAQTAVGVRDHLQIYGNNFDTRDGTGERDYIHVMDLANAHLKAVEALNQIDGHSILNVGTGQGVTVLELLSAFEAASGVEIRKVVGARREGDLPSFYADPSRANTLLEWLPKYTTQDMCMHSWSWQSQNPEGYSEDRVANNHTDR